MGVGEFKDKISDAVDKHGDKIKKGVDKAADFADEKTGGKYSEHIDKAQEAVADWTDSDEAGSEATTDATETHRTSDTTGGDRQ
ncbi:MAG TPA: antitoxin [Jiangellaceae bacterium]